MDMVRGLSGREFLERLIAEGGAAPMARHLGLRLVEVGDGVAVFTGEPDARYLNPAGAVHGGWVSTLLDSALGCAIHSRLPGGIGYGTIELKVNFVRPITPATGPVTCRGEVVHMGRRMATSEGRVVDAAGKLLAHGSCTCLFHESVPD